MHTNTWKRLRTQTSDIHIPFGNDAPIALASWANLLALEVFMLYLLPRTPHTDLRHTSSRDNDSTSQTAHAAFRWNYEFIRHVDEEPLYRSRTLNRNWTTGDYIHRWARYLCIYPVFLRHYSKTYSWRENPIYNSYIITLNHWNTSWITSNRKPVPWSLDIKCFCTLNELEGISI